MNTSTASPAPSRPIRVMLADDHETVLWGLCQLVESAKPNMHLAGRAKSADELMSHPALDDSDVVVLDLGMTRKNSLDVIETLHWQKGLNVVVLTGSMDPQLHRDAIRRGAKGLVLKSQPADSLLSAIVAVHAGQVQINEDVSSMFAKMAKSEQQTLAGTTRWDSGGMVGTTDSDRPKRGLASLTPKERAVIEAVVKHRSAKALVAAEALGISEHTLRNHLTTIYSKLNLNGKIDLYDFALKHGLVEPTQDG